jgi:hypothetical protein
MSVDASRTSVSIRPEAATVDQFPSVSPPTGTDVTSALAGLRGIAHAARVILADDDREIAIPGCLRLLRQVDEMLSTVAAGLADDGRTWRAVRARRDELGVYLLATETLRDVGVNPDAVIALLRRGVALADANL